MKKFIDEINKVDSVESLAGMLKTVNRKLSEVEGDLSVYMEADKTAPGIADRIDILEMLIQDYKFARVQIKKRIVTLDLIDNLKKACSYEKNI